MDVVLSSWSSIFESRMGIHAFQIGRDIFPRPQIMGFLLHELIPLEFAARHPDLWRREETTEEKDIVYIPDPAFSVELKTSSNPSRIFGNRSYAQPNSRGKKAKDGYYLAVNFEKFSKSGSLPAVKLIRFGWLDATDWKGQKAETGQQSHLPPEVESSKLLRLYEG